MIAPREVGSPLRKDGRKSTDWVGPVLLFGWESAGIVYTPTGRCGSIFSRRGGSGSGAPGDPGESPGGKPSFVDQPGLVVEIPNPRSLRGPTNGFHDPFPRLSSSLPLCSQKGRGYVADGWGAKSQAGGGTREEDRGQETLVRQSAGWAFLLGKLDLDVQNREPPNAYGGLHAPRPSVNWRFPSSTSQAARMRYSTT